MNLLNIFPTLRDIYVNYLISNVKFIKTHLNLLGNFLKDYLFENLRKAWRATKDIDNQIWKLITYFIEFLNIQEFI